jgi:hypothetical protein
VVAPSGQEGGRREQHGDGIAAASCPPPPRWPFGLHPRCILGAQVQQLCYNIVRVVFFKLRLSTDGHTAVTGLATIFVMDY